MNVELLMRMFEISRELAQTRNINQLLPLALNEAAKIVGANLGYLVLANADNDLDVRARCGEALNEEKHGDALSRTIFDTVIKSGEAIVITDALADAEYSAKSSVVALKIRSVMCVPLIVGGRTIGAIYVENRKVTGAFRDADLVPFTFFANQVAVSIENALIIESLEERVAARTADLETSWHEAVEANKLRMTFFGQLAHDMRNPASVITFALSTLQHPKVGDLNPAQQKWISRATEGATQINRLIDNIFDLSKVELNALEVQRKPVDLKQFLERMHDIAHALPWQDAVKFKLEIPDVLPEIEIDTVRIQQVIMNLISNALKFTAAGEVVLHAKVLNNSEVEIGVRDTGEGIPDDVQQQVFERFRQFDTDAGRKLMGAGLGLAICKELVEKHGGRIRVTSTPNQGSDFVFTLPC